MPYSKSPKNKNILQADLFAGLSPLQTRLIARRGDFDELFKGFIRMRAVSYVLSPTYASITPGALSTG